MEEDTIIMLEPSIDSEAKYWMVRTMGGDFYKEYVEDGFIAIGYNEITLQDLIQLPESDSLSREIIEAKLKNNNQELKNTSYPASQLLRFIREMNIGDFVIVPAKNSQYVSFGIITSDVYEAEDRFLHLEGLCPYAKRRMIEWKKTSPKYKLNPALQLMFNSRHIISNVDYYAPYIDSLLNDFYLKDDEAHLVLRINTHNDINAGNFFAIYEIFRIVDRFCKENNINEDIANIVMKVQMESPGSVRLSSKHTRSLIFVGLAILGICGGGLEIDAERAGFHLSLSTGGLIDNFSRFLDRGVDQQLKSSIKNSLDSLDMSSPKNMDYAIQLLETLNQSRKKY